MKKNLLLASAALFSGFTFSANANPLTGLTDTVTAVQAAQRPGQKPKPVKVIETSQEAIDFIVKELKATYGQTLQLPNSKVGVVSKVFNVQPPNIFYTVTVKVYLGSKQYLKAIPMSVSAQFKLSKHDDINGKAITDAIKGGGMAEGD